MTAILERNDFYTIADRMLDELCADAPQNARNHAIRMTSGTSGNRPLFIACGKRAMHAFPCGAKRILICQGALAMRLHTLLCFRNGDDREARALVVDARDMATGLSELLADFAPDRVYGLPFFVVKVSEYLDDATRSNVSTLRGTGAGMSAQDEKVMRERFPNAQVKMLYSSSEAGPLAAESCGYLPRNHYHTRDDVVIEIIDADEEGVGEILVSKRLSEHIYIERYRIGDLARFRDVACPCGAHMTFEIMGRRGHDYLKLAGALLRREEFDRIAGLCADLFDDYTCVAGTVESRGTLLGKITLNVYRKDGRWNETIENDIKKRFTEGLFLTASKTLGDLVKKGIMIPLEVRFSGDPFPITHKGSKLRQR